MSIDSLLRGEIRDELEHLSKMEVGSDGYRTTVDGVTKLTDRLIEIEKLDLEHEDKVRTREIDERLKLVQMERDRKDALIKNCLTGAGILVGAVITVWGTVVSMNFEKEGTFTTSAGRKHIAKALSWIK